MNNRRVDGTPPAVQDFYALEPQAHELLNSIPSYHADKVAFIRYVLLQAQKKRADSGYSGSMHDGGAGDLERQVETYIAGLSQTIPANWLKYQQEYNRINDPEFAKYKELAERFGPL